MANHTPWTEEGRTRLRNFQKRFNSYLVLWIIVGIMVASASVYLRTRYGFEPLQSLYLIHYVRASMRSLIPTNKLSKFRVLVRVMNDERSGKELVIGVNDSEVTPVMENGKVKYDPRFGPSFKLKEGIPHKRFLWTEIKQTDKEMYQWMRRHVYEGKSLTGIYWLYLLPCPLVVIAGMLISLKIDMKANKEYEEGELNRGTRWLKAREYAKEPFNKGDEDDGLSLTVMEP